MNHITQHCTFVTEPTTQALETPPRRRWPLVAALASATAVVLALAGAAIYSHTGTADPPPGNRILPWTWTSDDPTAVPAAGGAGESPAQPEPTNTRPRNPGPTSRTTPAATPAVQQPPASPSKASPRPRSPLPLTTTP